MKLVTTSRVSMVGLTCTGACSILLTPVCPVSCSTTNMPKWKAEYRDILVQLFFCLVEWKGTQESMMNFSPKTSFISLFVLFFFHFPSFWPAYSCSLSFSSVSPLSRSSGSHSLPSEGSLHIVHHFSPSLPLPILRSQAAVAEAIVSWKSKPFSAQNAEKLYRLFFCFLS